MRISVIAAMSRDFLIGTEAGLPWRLPKDLRRFRELTWGKPVIMGRKTLELIGGPLKGRQNIVLTRNDSYRERDLHIAHNIPAATLMGKGLARQAGADEVMVIGGGEVYRAFLPEADRLYLSIIDGSFVGSVYFPDRLPPESRWRVEHDEHHAADERNLHPHRFLILDRVRTAPQVPPPALSPATELGALLAIPGAGA
jgi:dihydrofolate reductase